MKNYEFDLKKLIQEKGFETRYSGIAPDGFILVHEKTLEDLKNWFTWEEWKKGNITIEELNKNNFDNN